jgi:hypothetical protein
LADPPTETTHWTAALMARASGIGASAVRRTPSTRCIVSVAVAAAAPADCAQHAFPCRPFRRSNLGLGFLLGLGLFAACSGVILQLRGTFEDGDYARFKFHFRRKGTIGGSDPNSDGSDLEMILVQREQLTLAKSEVTATRRIQRKGSLRQYRSNN